MSEIEKTPLPCRLCGKNPVFVPTCFSARVSSVILACIEPSCLNPHTREDAIEACAQLAEQKIGNFWDRMETVAAIRALSHETHSSDGGGENRRPATTGNKSGAAPEAEQSSSATSFVRAFEEGQTSQARAGVAPGPSEASSAGALQGSQCNRGDNESDPAVTQDCAPAGTVRLSDARTIIAGIRQFGLAADGSDLRDLEAAIDRLSRQPEAEPVACGDSEGRELPIDAEAMKQLRLNPTVEAYWSRFSIPLYTSPRLDREKVARLLTTAKLLLQNAIGCAANHYGQDFEQHGKPGWLMDAEKDIAAADAIMREAR